MLVLLAVLDGHVELFSLLLEAALHKVTSHWWLGRAKVQH